MSTTKVDFSVPGHRSPGVGYEAPFEMLEACHERVTRMLDLLARARSYGKENGCDESFISALTDVMRYFDHAAPQHHLDEERHVFPIVLAMNDAGLNETVARLQSDHKRMEVLWASVRTMFVQAEKLRPVPPVFSSEEDVLIDEFIAIYGQHISAEEGKVYPAGISQISASALTEMAADMMQRRGVKQVA